MHGRVSDRERAAEEAELRRNDVVIAITPRDADTFGKVLGSEGRVETIGMGVDLKRWNRELFAPQRRTDTIVYYGNMSAEMNVQAAAHLCREVLPELRKLREKIEIIILGADPAPQVRKLAELPEVHVTGTVEDPRPVLATSGVFALTLRAASGIRSRACEAMGLEVPTVAYPESLEGMGFEEDRHFLAARDPREFALQIDRILGNPELAKSISKSARDVVRERYGRQATYGRFVDLYRELIEGFRT